MRLSDVFGVVFVMLSTSFAQGAVRYVDLKSTNPVSPFEGWSTAATNIQDAIDVASPGDKVLVTDGIYSTRNSPAPDSTAARVVVTNALVIESVNGSSVTAIDGGAAVRCVYLGSNSVLSGFALTNGTTGLMCESVSALALNCSISGNLGDGVNSGSLSNCSLVGNLRGAANSQLFRCSIVGNRGGGRAGGAYSCTLNNCVLTGNSGAFGGGAAYSYLTNCIVYGNTADDGGGVNNSTLSHCVVIGNTARMFGGGFSMDTKPARVAIDSIILFNSAPVGSNYLVGNYLVGPTVDPRGIISYCCTMPLPPGSNNITLDPQLASFSHPTPNSPCVGAGNPQNRSGVDIDGKPWADPPSIGCSEVHGGSVTGFVSVAIQAQYINAAEGFPVRFTGLIEGQLNTSVWDFQDGSTLSNAPSASHAWASPGDYSVGLTAYNDTNPGGVRAGVTVHIAPQPVHHVDLNSTNPNPPYLSWATAATNIQDAVDAAETPGAMVVVAKGVYQTGGRVASGTLSNRVAVTKPIILQSANGPSVTTITGYRFPGSSRNTNSVRCLYLTNGASACGFTLSNGAAWGSWTTSDESGGGVLCESLDSLVSNCVLTANSAAYWGGGACYGTLQDCTVVSNSTDLSTYLSFAGGARFGALNNCLLLGNSSVFGGGVDNCALRSCTLIANSSQRPSLGGATQSSLENCLILTNLSGGAAYSLLTGCTLAWNSGGGAYECILDHSTLTNNWAGNGGGAWASDLTNCLVSGNWASGYGGGVCGGTLTRCTVVSNWAGSGGGASGATHNYVLGCSLDDCLLVGNWATNQGGGTYHASYVRNCSVVANSATNAGGGSSQSMSYNSIIYYNEAPTNANSIYGQNLFCCVTEDGYGGAYNVTNAPLFVDLSSLDLHLASNSPCINSGKNAYATSIVDFDGKPRNVGGTVDIGAYEFQEPTSAISYAWLELFGLPADGSADCTDPDHDGMNNWQEWIGGTNPTNALSALVLLTPTSNGTNVTVTWQSVYARSYSVERSSDVRGPFTRLATGIFGQAGTTTLTDPDVIGSRPFFYRVSVTSP